VDPNDIPPDSSRWPRRSIRIPWLVVIALLVALAVALFLRYTRLDATYTRSEAILQSRLRGIEVNRVVFFGLRPDGMLRLAGYYTRPLRTVNPADAGSASS